MLIASVSTELKSETVQNLKHYYHPNRANVLVFNFSMIFHLIWRGSSCTLVAESRETITYLLFSHKDAADCDGRGKTQWNAAQMQRTTFPSSPLCFSFFSSPLFSFPASWARSSWQVGQWHDAFWQLSNFTAVSRLALTLFFNHANIHARSVSEHDEALTSSLSIMAPHADVGTEGSCAESITNQTSARETNTPPHNTWAERCNSINKNKTLQKAKVGCHWIFYLQIKE